MAFPEGAYSVEGPVWLGIGGGDTSKRQPLVQEFYSVTETGN